jgi:hypothetical protein
MAEPLGGNVAIVFNGFLALSMKEKIRLVDVMNEFFDYPDRREQMRAANEEMVAGLISTTRDTMCKCCRK